MKPQQNTVIKTVTIVLAVIWVAFVLNFILLGHLNELFAVKPRSLFGIIGILLHPFAHGGIGHIVANSIPFFILSLLVGFSSNLRTLVAVWIIGTMGSGIGIWLLSSNPVVGASGVVFALNGYILARSFFYPKISTIVAATVALLLYSGTLFSLLNIGAEGISWIGHISGFITGIATAFLMRNLVKQIKKEGVSEKRNILPFEGTHF